MTPFELLCHCFDEPSESCCDRSALPPAAPIQPSNPPGLSAIRYRIGTFTSFRRAMLDELAQAKSPDPFAGWHEGTDGDYQTIFIELWAYLADVLTFYQERIANEAFLPTATQRDSLLRLCRLIDYRPGPGAGASVLLAFAIEKNKTVSIPAGFRAGNKPAPGKDPAVFETGSALTAFGSYSAIPMSAAAPTNQFATLSDYRLVAVNPTETISVAQAAAAIYLSAGAAYLQSFISNPVAQLTKTIAIQEKSLAIKSIAVRATVAPRLPTLKEETIIARFIDEVPSLSYESRFFLSENTRPVVLKGTNPRLAVGDYVLIVEREGEADEKTTLRQLDSVRTDKASDTTTIFWNEEANVSYDSKAAVFALRVTASPFGSNAPAWNTLSPTLTNSDNKHGGAPFDGRNWDDDHNAASKVPTGDQLFLDSTYPDAKGSPGHPGWVVLFTDGRVPEIFHVNDTRPLTASDYSITAKVTRLSLGSGESIPALAYPLRATVLLTGAEQLALQNNLPLPEPLAGATLILAGLYPLLDKGQKVMVRGKRIDPATQQPADTPTAEEAILAGKPLLDADNNITTVVLQKALEGQYARASAVLLANIVDATQGETVRDEVLGSSDGSALQSFPLKKKPLTYLPASDPEGLAAVQSTLLVRVNGVRWNEKPTLFQSAADAQEYTTSSDDASQTTVTFGDGVFGARPPSGKDNIRARYRKALGASGNVAADAVSQLLDSIPGLQKVTNPQPSVGGADSESIDQIRTNAPASLRTFGRAVSAADYSALALSFPGVAKASAAWVLRNPLTGQAVVQPYIHLTVATADQTPLAEQLTFARNLRNFLDRRRDPNMPLRLSDFTPVYIDVVVDVDVDDRYPRQATISRVQTALSPNPNSGDAPGYFSFEHLQFGQSIHLSDLYAAVQAVSGVRDAVVRRLRRPDQDPDPATVRDDIFIRPAELAVLKNDPLDAAKGLLTVNWQGGGFVDT
jgi:hypothetical protein